MCLVCNFTDIFKCFQLLDLPGIIEGAKDGKGRGKQVIAGRLTVNTLYMCISIQENDI